MKTNIFIILLFFSLNDICSQTDEITLGKRVENFKFNETTYRHVKRHFKGNNKTIDKGTAYIKTVNKCYPQKHLTINYYEIGLIFKFKQNNKTKKYLLKSITIDSLSKDFINYTLRVNLSKTNEAIKIFGHPKNIANDEMIFGSNKLIFKFDKDSVIRQIIINSNRLHYITEANF